MKKKIISYGTWLIALGMMLVGTGCTKIQYTHINDPAYIRVFNDLNYAQTIENLGAQYPDLCMIINPVLTADGTPTGGDIVGDFLDKRAPYAPPYPSHIGNSTTQQNPEFPGKANVLVGPILNGFDLSSWAQTPSGKVRIMFWYRPYTETPFFQLDDKLKHNVLIDTTLTLDANEVYTFHVLQKDFTTKKIGLLIRQETFEKLPLADTLAYVNFYNYSAKGFVQADQSLKPTDPANTLRTFISGIKDQMNIYLTLYNGQVTPATAPIVTNFERKYITQISRNTEYNGVNPYLSFPLWAVPTKDSISTDMWQRFELLDPGLDINTSPYRTGTTATYGNFAAINCILNGKVTFTAPLSNGVNLPNLLVTIPSGTYPLRSFATVSTFEIVNSNVYLTTIQRKYPAPQY